MRANFQSTQLRYVHRSGEKAPCAKHRSPQRAHCLAQFHARKRVGEPAGTRPSNSRPFEHSLGAEVISQFLIFSRDNGGFCWTIWHRVSTGIRIEKGCRAIRRRVASTPRTPVRVQVYTRIICPGIDTYIRR